MTYDAITTRYGFSCPVHGAAAVALHDFRQLERLPGAAHPAVYRVRFACGCGDEHPGLISHDDLDYAPLGLEEGRYLNLMTSRLEDVAAELGDLAVRRIRAGEWPWTFFCCAEERPKPVFPSAFTLMARHEGWVGVAVRCPSCGRLSVNLVSPEHVDLPFHTDAEVGVVRVPFPARALRGADEFARELRSTPIELRRIAA